LAKVRCPWRLRPAWDRARAISGFHVHEKTAPSLSRVPARIAARYDAAQIAEIGIDLFGGDYAPRPMRGGAEMPLHGWGIALDFDPERNQLGRGRFHARLAQPDCIPFWEAREAEGWVSLGRARNYDWMHVQAAKL
jgi:hypothetical protein